MDYLVLMQRTWQDDPGYLDVEGVIYHYPERYFSFIAGYERFIYYRPARGAAAGESSSYFGFGTLGEPFPDPNDPTHRFVPIRQYARLPHAVSYQSAAGAFYESAFSSRTAFTGRSVRHIAPTDFFRILAAGQVVGEPFARLEDTEAIAATQYSPLFLGPPTQPLRVTVDIPPGTGYRPTMKPIDVYESAALQERARADHQRTLKLIQELVHHRGGETLMNNNVDLLANVRGRRLLIEAKSINNPKVVVDRMRYGIGQLSDYAIRYRGDIGEAERVLAFGAPPPADAAWISSILQESEVAFVALEPTTCRIRPMNDRAASLPLFEPV